MAGGPFFPFAQNIRSYENGQLGPRPALSDPLESVPGGAVNSILRLVDTTPNGPLLGFVHVFGRNTGDLNVGTASVLGPGNLSGLRLAMATYRPDATPQPWVYIADRNRLVKVNSGGTLYKTGIAEPQVPAVALVANDEQFQAIGQMQTSPGPWSPFGTGGALSQGNNSTPVLVTLYDSGPSGQASLVLNIGSSLGANVIYYAGGNVNQPVFNEAMIAASGNTAIATITYDSGTTGPCTITTTTVPATIGVNRVYRLGLTEWVRVQSAIIGLSSVTIRCATVSPHAAGETMTGYPSIRALVPFGGSIASLANLFIQQTITTGTGGMQNQSPANTATLSTILGSRSVQPTDLLHFCVTVVNQPAVTSLNIYLNLDPNIIDFSTNAFRWTINPATLNNGTFSDVFILVGSLTRLGTNTQLDLTTGVNGIKIQWVTTGSVIAEYTGLNLVGQYGPNGTGANAPVVYRYTYRSDEGAVSNPSPPMRTGVVPDNVSVEVQTTPSLDPQVKWIDIYRGGGSFTEVNGVEEDHYVGTVPNTVPPAPPVTFIDAQDDLTVVDNPLLEFDNFEPFPSIDLPAKGTVSINGYTVTLLSGTPFNLRWAPGTLINIGGTTFTLYNRPQSTSQLTVLENGGTQLNVPYQIKTPTLLAQVVPTLFGPTDNTGFFFAVGDPLRPGTLYFTKGNNPDSAPDTNQIEVTSPAEPLMNGVLVNGLAMVFSSERAWWIYPQLSNAVATITGTQGQPFQLIEAISNRGLYAFRGITTDGGGTVFFIAKDGIYMSVQGAGSVCITDSIYSLFPHEDSAQSPVTIGATAVQPPDFTYPDGMALSFSEGRLYFDYNYYNAALAPWTLVFDMRTMTWAVDVYTVPGLGAPGAYCHAPQIGSVIESGLAAAGQTGTLVGCTDGSVRQFDPAGTESFVSILQRDPRTDGADGWSHVKEINVDYVGGPLTLRLTPDQGQTPADIILPAQTARERTLFTIGASKFKLVQYFLSMSVTPTATFRLWTGNTISKHGDWARQQPYRPVQPFADFANVKTGGSTTVITENS